MRKTLIAAVAMAPLILAAGAVHAADGTTNVTTSTTTPISTGGTANTNITISSGGSISAAQNGVNLVTLNSNDYVWNVAGTLSSSNFNNVTAIYALGGTSGNYILNASAISLTTTYAPATSVDGYSQAPFAGTANLTNLSSTGVTGVAGLYGIRLVGTQAFGGYVDNSSTGSITIKGNNSYGMSIEAPITGYYLDGFSRKVSIGSEGSISLTGDNGVALNVAPPSGSSAAYVGGTPGANNFIAQNILISGAITATGTNSSAVRINGNIGGRLGIYSSISATGYAITSRTSNLTLLGKIQGSGSQTNLANAAVIVGGNVDGGIYIGGAPAGTVTGSEADLAGDGGWDGAQSTGAIASYGSAPALLIGASGSSQNITIGGFNDANALSATNPNGNNDYLYGLVSRGSITDSGVYDGFSATALQIGYPTGGTVNLTQGIALYGSVSAQAYYAPNSSTAVSATAIQLNGAISPNINIFGTVSASVTQSSVAAVAVPQAVSAVGISETWGPGSGAQLQNLLVMGSISATATGNNATAIAVQDASGTLSNVTNKGVISATNYVSTLGNTQLGQVPLANGQLAGPTVALDLSANSTGVTLTQIAQTTQELTHFYGSTSGTTATTSSVATAFTPYIQGDVYLGSGANKVDLEAGGLIGALSMGSGTGGSLTLNGGASINGAFSFGGTGLAINLANGALNDRSPTTVNAASLQIGATSSLSFAFNPASTSAANQISQFVVNGAAVNGSNNVVIANGAKFGLTAVSLPTLGKTYSYNVISSNLPISLGGATSLTLTSTPYIFDATLSQPSGNPNELVLQIQSKTAAQMGLNASEGALLGSLLTVAPKDQEVQSALLAPTNRKNFLKIYDAFLPESAGGIFEAGRLASDAVSRATSTHDMTPGVGGTQNFWMQEIAIGAHSERTSANNPYDVGGFGAVAGAAMGGYGFGAVGVTAALTSISVLDPELKGAGQQAVTSLEAGLYWQASVKHLTLDLRAAFGGASIDGTRQLFAYDQTTGLVAVNRTVKDNHYGYMGTLHGGASYEWSLGSGFFIRPQARLDYFYMAEDSYKEKDLVALGTGAGFPSAFALSVNSRNGDALTGVATMAIGANWGSDFRLRPQIEVGLRDAIAGSPGTTTAQFVSGGTPFTLTPSPINGVGGVLRLGLKASTNFYEVGIEAGGETHDRYYSGDARVTIRLMF